KAMQNYAPRFVCARSFDRRWVALGLDDDDQRALELAIQSNPDGAPLVKGTGGLRKIRFAAPGSGRGQSGAYRIGYAHSPIPGIILLLQVWAKNDKADLSQADRAAVRVALARFNDLIKTGKIR